MVSIEKTYLLSRRLIPNAGLADALRDSTRGDTYTIAQKRCGHTKRGEILPDDVLIVPAGTPNVCWHREPTEDIFINGVNNSIKT